jgi:uncharacterized protein (TIGR03437 family)
MAYDQAHQRLLAFGLWNGVQFTRGSWIQESPQSWSAATTDNDPQARAYHAMTYDSAREQVVLFGGWDGGNPGLLNDTWTWNGRIWTQTRPASAPSPRRGAEMVYDGARREVVLFGGEGPNGLTNETWVWDGTEWQQRRPAASPGARRFHKMAYDAARRQVVLFGGEAADGAGVQFLNDTWVWDGSNWTQKNPVDSPTPRSAHAMAYGVARGRVVLFGGWRGVSAAYWSDTWEWNGDSWTLMRVRNTPAGRYGHAMVYDNRNGGFLVYGGMCADGVRDEAWMLVPTESLLLSSKSELQFSYTRGGAPPSSQAVSIASATTSSEWSATASPTWVSVARQGASLNVSVIPYELGPGTYSGTISITQAGADNNPQQLTVYLTVTPAVGGATPCATCQIDSTHIVTTISGGATGFYGDGEPGLGRFDISGASRAIAAGKSGDLFVADTRNHRIRRIGPGGVVGTIAGTGGAGPLGDGGPALSASLNGPKGVVLDSQGRLYVADSGNGRVRRVNTNGAIQTVAGGGSITAPALRQELQSGPVSALNMSLSSREIALDNEGRLYVDEIRVKTDGMVEPACCARSVFDAQGNVFTPIGDRIFKNGAAYAGTGVAGFFGDGGPLLAAQFNEVGNLALDSQGNLFVADVGNRRIRVISAAGALSTVVGNGQEALGSTGDGDGGTAGRAKLGIVNGLAIDGSDNLYFSEMIGTERDAVKGSRIDRIRKVSVLNAPTTGNAPAIRSADGVVNGASFVGPVARGSWATIYGQNLTTGASRIWDSRDFSDNRLPTTLEGTNVTFNGTAAAVYFVSATQLNVQVPDGLPEGVVNVKVTTSSGSASAAVVHQAIAPGLFTTGAGTGTDGKSCSYPAAVHLDGALVGRTSSLPGSRPATPGEILLVFGTGFGASNPAQPAGMLHPPTLLGSLPFASIGGVGASVSAGALISPGLYQFNVVVPPGLAAGVDHPMQIGFSPQAVSQVGVCVPLN